MRAYEKRQEKNGLLSLASNGRWWNMSLMIRITGQPVKHGMAKEMLAGIAMAEVDKLFETKGLDYLDKEKAKREAKKQAEQLYDEKYEQ